MYDVLNWSLGSRGLKTVADLGFGQREGRKKFLDFAHILDKSQARSDFSQCPRSSCNFNCQIYMHSPTFIGTFSLNFQLNYICR